MPTFSAKVGNEDSHTQLCKTFKREIQGATGWSKTHKHFPQHTNYLNNIHVEHNKTHNMYANLVDMVMVTMDLPLLEGGGRRVEQMPEQI